MIFIILPMSVYTLFIMRMKPNKQNTSGISNCTAKKARSSLLGAISLTLTLPLAEYEPLCPLGQAVLQATRWADPLAVLRQVETTGSAILPWALIR